MSERFEATTTTTCGYCGVGCRLEAHRADGRIVSISPAMDGPANKGHTCVKGRFAHQFARSRDRLTAPLVRESGGFRIASWEEAIARVTEAFTRIKAEHGPDAIAGLASSRATNEDCYVMQRLMRAAIGTHNIDNCSRVCHSPTSFALRKAFGLSGATGSFDDIEAADAALLIGVNPTQGHPVVGARIKQAAIRGLKLVTADPRRIELADYGQLHLGIRPGTNAALLNGLAHVVIRDGLVDRDFVEKRTEGYDAVAELVAAYTPENVEEITGAPAAGIERAAHLYAEAERACILWGLGVTEHLYGSECVQLICNLALLTGNVGRPGAALLPLRGQNNVQGSSDHGALPDTFTDYRPVTDDAVTSAFEERWGVTMKRERGMKIPEMFDAAVDGSLKAMYIFGEDVAQTDPDTTHVIQALESLDFLVCQDIFETETTKYADVILPASAFLEKTGTFTNAERRLQLVSASAEPPGAARTDFEILTTVSRALGHDMGYETPSDVMDEIAEMTPRYAGISHERIGRAGLQWPVAPDGTDTPILYTDRFELPGGRAHFAPLPYKPPGDQADAEFPLILVTGRRLEHYNAGTMTRRTGNLELMSSDWLEVHPADAAALGVADGQEVAVRSRRGMIRLPARVTERIEEGHVFTAFHFPEVRTNLLIGPSADVNTSCPEYKVVAVSVQPIGAERSAPAPARAEPMVPAD
ncbi:MAG: formate dehydrogenase subunit alpha [Thermoleophilaceae bacterium]|nr:formate dehydrogenase subunit alpha [Thermoleophilaceae bacterium]